MTSIDLGALLLGRYRVERLLGQGGMGVVVLATHLQLARRVAVKFLISDALSAEGAIDRFLREARAAVQFRGEHVARVIDVGTFTSGAPFIVMEYLEGLDLGKLLDTRGPLPITEAVDYVLQVCEALSEAHTTLGIVHRDLKPSNLFLTQRPDGSPLIKVLDFGISKMQHTPDSSFGAITSATAGVSFLRKARNASSGCLSCQVSLRIAFTKARARGSSHAIALGSSNSPYAVASSPILREPKFDIPTRLTISANVANEPLARARA
jgi:serine/threonine protein kinase